MASIRSRSGKWQAQVRLASGPQLSKSFSRKADAVTWARSMESDIQSGRYKEHCLVSLADVLNRYSLEVTPRKRGAGKELLRIKRLLKESFMSLGLDDLKPAHIARFRDKRLQTVGAQAVRHDLNLLDHALRLADREWGLTGSNPIAAIKKPAQPPARSRRLKPEEMRKFLGIVAENQNAHFRAFVTLAIETGMRQGELLAITWRDVDFERSTAYLAHTKNGLARAVPLTKKAAETLSSLSAVRPPAEKVLPLSVPLLRYQWDKTAEKARMSDFHMHDLRREAVSRFFELGLSVPEVASISGHQDLRMVARYVKFNTEQLVDKLAKLGENAAGRGH